jgi:hypothetical protein
MKRSRFTEEQILFALKQAAAGPGPAIGSVSDSPMISPKSPPFGRR